ncbi:hypothetical protein VTO42DRAFT_1330 [Malbranchea cinnamomea]
MPALLPPSSTLAALTVELGSFHEDEDYFVFCEPEPRKCSQTLRVRSHDLVWWVRVTFTGGVLQLKARGDCKKQKKSERRNVFQQFIQSIDYRSFSLLNDTVTEIVLQLSQKQMNLVKIHQTSQNIGNIFVDYAEYFACDIREDPQRVIYPPCSEFPSLQIFNISQISDR